MDSFDEFADIGNGSKNKSHADDKLRQLLQNPKKTETEKEKPQKKPIEEVIEEVQEEPKEKVVIEEAASVDEEEEQITGFDEDSVNALLNKITASIAGLCNEEIKYYARQRIEEEVDKLRGEIPEKELKRLKIRALEKSGYGVIEKFLADETITEIIVQKFDDIYIERNGLVEPVEEEFPTEKEFINVINKIVGQRGKAVNYSHPIVDTTLFDGSRVSAQIPPIVPDGATMTIRKFSKDKLTMDDLIEFGSITPEAAEFLKELVRKRASVLITGGTGTGKTTVLNILSGYIPKHEMIVTIEDTPELMLQTPRVRRLITRESINSETDNITIRELVKTSLRMRPDRIIVGETRGKEVIDYFSATATGHEGSMSTMHANSPQEAVHTRVPVLYGTEASEKTIKLQFAEAVDFIIQLKRFPNGQRKIVEIAYVKGFKDDDIEFESIFLSDYDDNTKDLVKTGEIPDKYLEV